MLKIMLKGTPLHVACNKGHTDLAIALVYRGADINAIDYIKGTPLHERYVSVMVTGSWSWLLRIWVPIFMLEIMMKGRASTCCMY